MSWYEAIGKAADAIEALKNAELNQLLATVRMEGAKLAEENARLREELIALREAAKLRAQMVPRDNVYWKRTESGEADGPYCPTCWDGSGRAARLADEDRYQWNCPVCKEHRWKPGGRERWSADANAAHERSHRRDEQW